MAKVEPATEKTKLKVETYELSQGNLDTYEVHVYNDGDEETRIELVTLDEIFKQVTNEKGKVDASLHNAVTNETSNLTISFECYMDTDFDNEAKKIFVLIIERRELVKRLAMLQILKDRLTDIGGELKGKYDAPDDVLSMVVDMAKSVEIKSYTLLNDAA